MGTANMLISAELMRTLLELPVNVKVIGRPDGNVMLTLRSELIPEDTPGVLGIWRKNEDGTVEFLRFDPCQIPAVPRGLD